MFCQLLYGLFDLMFPIALNLKPGSEISSFLWIQQCYELLSLINTAFAKLVVDIGYPVNRWEVISLHQYLNYSFHLLELLNSVSSSLSHLTHARLSFALALTLLQNSPSLAIKHLKAVQPQGSSKDYRGQQDREDGDKYNNFSSCPWKEKLAKPYLEIKQLIATSNSASLNLVDSCIYDVIVEKGEILREVMELNNAAASLASAMVSGKSSDAAKDLETRLGVLGKQQEALEKQVHYLFSKVFAARKELLLSVRQCKK
ncbi:hypothetical protein GOBAR_AA23933 [Gossypium barbadense]|uniref:Uncharacterized protein n=1 Tax=Gossypium barbadense TaxID=3634 RepID=A0A2P5X074_GOSBA|nr:hypothetical protein GOBAR_AA23933 [Gossypium barbadense]